MEKNNCDDFNEIVGILSQTKNLILVSSRSGGGKTQFLLKLLPYLTFNHNPKNKNDKYLELQHILGEDKYILFITDSHLNYLKTIIDHNSPLNQKIVFSNQIDKNMSFEKFQYIIFDAGYVSNIDFDDLLEKTRGISTLIKSISYRTDMNNIPSINYKTQHNAFFHIDINEFKYPSNFNISIKKARNSDLIGKKIDLHL